MSRDGSITLALGGKDRVFKFGLAEHRRLQEELDVGVSLIVQRLHPYVSAFRAGFPLGQVLDAGLVGDIRIEHIRCVVFNGLIGGGLAPNQAASEASTWVEQRPLLENAPLAYAIGLAALIGAEDEDASGELKGSKPRRSRGESSGSDKAASTPSARRRGSRSTRSTE